MPAFRSIDLAGTNAVTIRVGGRRSVVVRADDNLLSNVTTRVHAGVLTIADRGSFTAETPMSVAIALPSLDAVSLSGTGSVRADSIATRRFTVALAGTGTLRAAGSARTLEVTLSGSGDAQLAGLVARDVRAVVEGSGRIAVTATHALNAAVPGTGAIVYGGTPARVVTKVTGTGAVTRR